MNIQIMVKKAAIGFAASSIFCAYGATTAFAQSPVNPSGKTPVSTSVHLSGSCAQCDFSRRIMPGLSLQGANFVGTNFSHANLSGTNFDNANLNNATFHKAYLMKVVGKNAHFNHAVFRGTTLTDSKLIDSHFVEADMLKADLTRGTFSHSNFTKASLQSTDAVKTVFSGANFTDARLGHSDFTGADFSNVNFTDAKFGDARVAYANFEGAILTGARMAAVDGLYQSQLDQACGSSTTRLPDGYSLKTCPVAPKPPTPPVMGKPPVVAMVADVTVPTPVPVPTSGPVRAGITAESRDVTVRRFLPSIVSNRMKRRSTMISVRTTDLDEIMRGIDAAIGDLPMSSPTRVKLEKQRSNLEAVRAQSGN